MYLSRLILNPRSRRVQRDIASPREMHRTVLSGFPDELEKDTARVLFRLEQSAQSGLLSLLVQSTLPPEWSRLPDERYLLADGDHPAAIQQNPAVKEVDYSLSCGQMLSFRLRANPTKRLSAGKGNKGKRIGLYKLEDQQAWLARKAENSGFRIYSALPIRQNFVEGRKQHDLKFFSVQFDGVLQVTDPATFLAAIENGIGSGKAFGFGLLSVAPIG